MPKEQTPGKKDPLPILPGFLRQETTLLADGELIQNPEDSLDPAPVLNQKLTPHPPSTHVL